jgi:hypothetical protein
VAYTVDADDDLRRAIASYRGDPGLADRDTVRNWFCRFGDSMNIDIMESLDNQEDE